MFYTEKKIDKYIYLYILLMFFFLHSMLLQELGDLRVYNFVVLLSLKCSYCNYVNCDIKFAFGKCQFDSNQFN